MKNLLEKLEGREINEALSLQGVTATLERAVGKAREYAKRLTQTRWTKGMAEEFSTEVQGFSDDLEKIASGIKSESVELGEAKVNTPSDFRRVSAGVTKACGEAYMAALKLKGMFDQMEEIPGAYQKIYERTMKVMGMAGDAKQDAYQSEMEIRRIG